MKLPICQNMGFKRRGGVKRFPTLCQLSIYSSNLDLQKLLYSNSIFVLSSPHKYKISMWLIAEVWAQEADRDMKVHCCWTVKDLMNHLNTRGQERAKKIQSDFQSIQYLYLAQHIFDEKLVQIDFHKDHYNERSITHYKKAWQGREEKQDQKK
jgi:hypothetical protein